MRSDPPYIGRIWSLGRGCPNPGWRPFWDWDCPLFLVPVQIGIASQLGQDKITTFTGVSWSLNPIKLTRHDQALPRILYVAVNLLLGFCSREFLFLPSLFSLFLLVCFISRFSSSTSNSTISVELTFV